MILHFGGSSKPWHTNGNDSQEWGRNLARANHVDLESIPKGTQWSLVKEERHSRYLKTGLAINRLLKRGLAPIASRLCPEDNETGL